MIPPSTNVFIFPVYYYDSDTFGLIGLSTFVDPRHPKAVFLK